MHYSLIKQLGIMAVLVVTGLAYLSHGTVIQNDKQTVHPAPASHGLRVYLDPDTGRFAPPPEQSPPVAQASALTAQAGGPAPLTEPPPAEVRSSKAGGGFSIDLQNRFRPARSGPSRTKIGL